MSKRDEDLLAFFDKDKTAGTKVRKIMVAQHEEFTDAEWVGAGGVRVAASTSLAALDTWYTNCGDSPRAAWWAAQSSTRREDMRQAILALS